MPGGPEWIFILIIVLLLFGAKKLPELARGIGASIGEFKKAKDAFDQEIKQASEDVRVNTPKGLEPHRPQGAAGDSSKNATSDKGRETPA